jgi:hypothetical protein
MAEEVPISGGPETAKIRGPVAVPLLIIITLGIYGLVWWYKINKEMAELGAKHGTEELGTNPMLSLLALFPGALIIVPAIWTTITTYQRAKRAQQLVGVQPASQANPWLYGIFYVIISIVAYGYLQSQLNKVWELAGAAPAPPANPVPAV